MHLENSSVYELLKAKYFRSCGLLDAELGPKPSCTWRSLYSARWAVEGGSRWLVGDGWSLNIWSSKWLPRPCAFKVLTPLKPEPSIFRFSDLIKFDMGEWNINLLTSLFLPVDSEIIIRIPLCSSWPRDILTWHHSASGELTVRSAYHCICQTRSQSKPSTSGSTLKSFWALICQLDIPP